MPKTVTINLTETSAAFVRSFASIGRMVDTAVRVLDMAEGEVVSNEKVQDLYYSSQDLQEWKLALMEFHSQARAQLIEQGVKPLWGQNQS